MYNLIRTFLRFFRRFNGSPIASITLLYVFHYQSRVSYLKFYVKYVNTHIVKRDKDNKTLYKIILHLVI